MAEKKPPKRPEIVHLTCALGVPIKTFRRALGNTASEKSLSVYTQRVHEDKGPLQDRMGVYSRTIFHIKPAGAPISEDLMRILVFNPEYLIDRAYYARTEHFKERQADSFIRALYRNISGAD